MAYKKCQSCLEEFKWDDEVIEVRDEYYHKDCVTLYPTGYVAFLDEDCLGETENEDGCMASGFLEEGEYIDVLDEVE